MYSRLSMRVALAMTLAFTAACDDDDDPVGPGLDFSDIAAQCVVGTIDDATETVFETGTIDDNDCRIEDENDGLVEAYEIPQSAFGDMSTVQIDLESDFDGWLIVIDESGTMIDNVDDNLEGSEQLILTVDPEETETYYIVVYSFDGDDSGSYSLSVGPEDGGV